MADIRHARAVIVGSGLAGLSAALGLEGCAVLTRGTLGGGSSSLAQGGIAAAIGPGDSPEQHAADTVAVSGGIGDERVARALTAAAAGRVEWLQSLGARFDTTGSGLALGHEAGHSARRIVHAHGDATGAEVMQTLRNAVLARPDIDVYENHDLIDLVRRDGRVVGVLASSATGDPIAILAPAVILATGGIGGLYARTTNPPEVSGGGLAAAVRAGASLGDLEFVQFHPTALDLDEDPAPLLTEGLRGEGAVLLNDRGERFMLGRHPNAELAPRDVVARAVWAERMAGRVVYLDATEAVGAAFPQRFPTVWKSAMRAGVDPRRAGLPVTPAAHYAMGGVVTDLSGRTSLPGLWAVGEVACTGLHGANRLASNSLLEAMVFGAAASCSVAAAGGAAIPLTRLEVPAEALGLGAEDGDVDAEARRTAIRALMWERVGLVRDERGLEAALEQLQQLAAAPRVSVRERNLVLVARLIAEAALRRKESRGAHWRGDHREADPAQARRAFVSPRPARGVPLSAPARRAA